ncbi:TIGR03086 family protein [Nocardioides sp. MAH-18]|uniref:TIGR03086 family protein n=1 Tax=Nocardioides agri TaxID=2682843 RepID=A0A6L6XR04_9ACTN|nr:MULTISPECIES: TIGR03086 family metal-binding protein [unclassified Nocardioides]MBA2954947.1 TIGR03086 family protein [Nocardioides sp. CGMCC 1.13656]MVQ49801.1 TIGR03086 family protein [Nocardioides sp. MAH-18]
MTAQLGESVELLERALAYTGTRLSEVDESRLGRRTPCADWRLDDLLAHMEDALDAFTEAAGGAVPVHSAAGRPGRVDVIRTKACELLGAWSRPGPGDVLVGGVDLPSRMLVATAALEVTVHGWDVAQAVGSPVPIPEALAAALLPVARTAVAPADRGVRFAAPRPVPADAPAATRLLAHLGRRT